MRRNGARTITPIVACPHCARSSRLQGVRRRGNAHRSPAVQGTLVPRPKIPRPPSKKSLDFPLVIGGSEKNITPGEAPLSPGTEWPRVYNPASRRPLANRRGRSGRQAARRAEIAIEETRAADPMGRMDRAFIIPAPAASRQPFTPPDVSRRVCRWGGMRRGRCPAARSLPLPRLQHASGRYTNAMRE